MEGFASVKIVVIGGAGNVGSGICEACSRHPGWRVIGVDPKFQEASLPEKFLKINSIIEDVDAKEFQSWFIPVGLQKHVHVEFIVTNDDGNRDNYACDPKLGLYNNARFESLVKRIAGARFDQNGTQCDRSDDRNVSVHVSYIGGSWTRFDSTKNLVVDDSSSVKEGGGFNPYEIAKTSAETNARKVSAKHAIALTFYDYISVVPNFAPNFSVNQMVTSGLEQNVIKFSPGDFGRPLLHTFQAGEFVADLIDAQIKSHCSTLVDNNGKLYETVLVPGDFISFETFAKIAREVIEHSCDDRNITFEEYQRTPNELRTRCISSRGFVSDPSLAEKGLKEAAMHSLKYFNKDMR